MIIKKAICLALVASSSFSMAETIYNMRGDAPGMRVSSAPVVVEEEEVVLIPGSCKDILDNKAGSASGVYDITNSGKTYPVYCDMTSQGGGWTMVVAQFESNPTSSWNEGIQDDYQPSLSSSRSFALNTEELPSHSQMTMSNTQWDGMTASGFGYFNYVYSTGNISKQELTMSDGKTYHIHRHNSSHYDFHDPELSFSSVLSSWSDTLTIDAITNSQSRGDQTYAFSLMHNVLNYRGFSYKASLTSTSQTGAWVVWAR